MATLFTETFTGTNGAAWPSSWTTGLTPTGGGAAIQNNAGRLTTGAQGSYSGAARVSRRRTTTYADIDTTVRWRHVTGESYTGFFVRADAALDTNFGYSVELSSWGDLNVYKYASYARTTLATSKPGFTANTWYRVRLRVVGSRIQVKVWADTATEPAAWAHDLTDATITSAGHTGSSVVAGSAASSSVVEVDDWTATDGASANIAPTANAGADQTAEPWAAVTLAGTDADSDGTISSRSWSQVSGTSVTLAGSGASRTFEAPATVAGGTLVFRYSVTDNAGATTTDDVAVTVLPAAERILIGGSWQPSRLVIV